VNGGVKSPEVAVADKGNPQHPTNEVYHRHQAHFWRVLKELTIGSNYVIEIFSKLQRFLT